MVAGSFNAVNEVNPDLTVTHQGSTTHLDFTYDKAGNLGEQELTSSTSLKYTHDAWGRLVKVEYVSGGATTRGEYQYNGLSQRVVKRSDHNIYDNAAALDEQRLMYYSGGWQIVEERIYDAWTAESPGSVDRIVQHVWGLRYIDDLVLNRQDSNADGDYTDMASPADFTHYALTDHQFSVVALIDSSSANLIERVEYTPYGEGRHHWKYDVDGDGEVDAADGTAVSTAYGTSIYQSAYNPDADFDRDGDVDRYDTLGSYAGALPPGQISAGSVGNSIGYCGYVFNGETMIYTVRYRHYDPQWGRWLSRDPLGHVDGMSLYQYVNGRSSGANDPFGFTSIDPHHGITDPHFWRWVEHEGKRGLPRHTMTKQQAWDLYQEYIDLGSPQLNKAKTLRDHRTGKVGRAIGIAAFIVVLGTTEQDAEAMSDDLYYLFIQLSNATGHAEAQAAATEIAARVAELYGTAALALYGALMERWSEMQRERGEERAKAAAGAGKNTAGPSYSPPDSPPPQAPASGPDPCMP